MTFQNRIYQSALFAIFSISIMASMSDASPLRADSELQHRLEQGEVIVDMKEIGPTKFVTGKILINEPIEHVWSVLTNPFEYAHQICTRIKKVDVVHDSLEKSEVKCAVDAGLFLPKLTYVIESKYSAPNKVEFRRLSGNIKDFKGTWIMSATADKKKTEVTYSTYLEPGFPLPQWIIREGLKMELPKSMLALRERVDAIFKKHAAPDPQSILTSRAVVNSKSNTESMVSMSDSAVSN